MIVQGVCVTLNFSAAIDLDWMAFSGQRWDRLGPSSGTVTPIVISSVNDYSTLIVDSIEANG